MTIYVDQPVVNRHMRRVAWCHMMTDGNVSELHEFARRIGMSKDWFQNHPTHPHYDLCKSFRDTAVKAGAKSVTTRQIVLLCSKFRKEIAARQQEAVARQLSFPFYTTLKKGTKL